MPGKPKKKAGSKSSPAKPRKATAKGKGPSPRGDWREETLARMRALILEADPWMDEEQKWRKPSNAMAWVPVWSHHGIVCTGETYKDKVKFTFAKGASLEDPTGLFNADDRGSTRRAIDLREGEMVDRAAFKALVQAAVDENAAGKKR